MVQVLKCVLSAIQLWARHHADSDLRESLPIASAAISICLLSLVCVWAAKVLACETGASSTSLPARRTRRFPMLETFSLLAAVFAALTFLPSILHSPNQPPLQPAALAANITELLVWLFTTGSLRLYWHSAHLHQLPLPLTLLWSAKAACSVAVAALQLSADSGPAKTSLQDLLPICSAAVQCLFVVAVLHERRITQQELRAWGAAQNPRRQQEDPQGNLPLHVSHNWASWLVFYWVNPLMARGSRRQLQASDLFLLPKKLLPSSCSKLLWGIWAAEQQAKTVETAEKGRMVQPSLLKALNKAYGLPYLLLGIIKLVNDILSFAGPVLLNVLLRYLETPSEPFESGIGKAADGQNQWAGKTANGHHLRPWLPATDSLAFGLCCAGLLGVTSLVKAILNSHYSYQQGQLSCQLRSAITCLVYKKALLVSTVDMTLFSSGAVQTLMSVDADRVVNLCLSLHELWSLPAQIAIALYLLYTQVEYAFLAGLVVVILLIPINRWLASKIEGASERMMAHKDARLQLMGELVRSIHQIKLSAWEPRFIRKVNEARQGEVQALAVRKYLDALCVYFWAATSLLFSLFTFGLFVMMGHKLTAEIVFTSLALFNVLISPLNSFPWVLNGIVEAVVSVRRLQGFLSSWESKSDWAYELESLEAAPAPGAIPESALPQHQRNALAEGLTSESPQMARADSSDLYTTINMERLPSLSPRVLGNAPSFSPWSKLQRQSSSSAPANPAPLQQRSGPPPSADSASGDVSPMTRPSPAARTFSTSFKGWGQGSSSTASASDHGSETTGSASDQGIVTVISDSSRLTPTFSGDGHSIVLSGASFAWQPMLGRTQVLSSQASRGDPPRAGRGHQGRGSALQPLLSDAAMIEDGSSNLVLRDINLTVRTGELLVVTGEIGAGKSSLLSALLGEMEQRCGHMRLQGSVAYVPQQPWILTGTLRNNILFGKDFEHERYTEVLKACALQADIDQMQQGDATPIGDRGVTLSGGQRARLSLARAIYQDCDIYLLDDILAAVDVHVAAWLTTHALTGALLGTKTRVLCSNASLVSLMADHSLRMYKGRVLTPEMAARLWGGDEAVRGGVSVRGARLGPSPLGIALGLADSISTSASADASEPALPADSAPQMTQLPPPDEESRVIGHVKWHVYQRYMKAVGSGLVLFVLLSLTLMQVTGNGNDLWLSFWVSNLDSPHHHPHQQPLSSSATCPSCPGAVAGTWHGAVAGTWSGAVAGKWPQLSSNLSSHSCLSRSSSPTAYPSFGRTALCCTEMNPMSPTDEAQASLLSQTNSSAVSVSAAAAVTDFMKHHVWQLLSRKQPVLDPSTKFYLSVLLCIAAANSVFTFVRAFSFAYGGLVAARKLHEQLLTSVINAPAKFFQTTVLGRVLNRFSSDTATADDALPFTLNILLANMFGLAGTIVVLCLSEPYLLLALLPLTVLYKYVQSYYRHTARELRRLNSIARSPVYATFTEALEGAASIRAYGAQRRFCQLNELQVAFVQQAAFAGIAAAQWLALRLQTIAALVITLVALLAVVGHEGLLPFAVSDGKFAASLVGLSLAYALPITDRLNGLLTVSAETEQEMVAVERLAEYTQLPAQPSCLHPHRQTPEDVTNLPFQRQGTSFIAAGWPQQGHLQFCNVRLSYGQESMYALDGVSFELRPGQKVGICGRTGAGKSSLVAALLRLTETQSGSILLDGRDCRTVPLGTLRRAIGVVPQTPFLFQGTIRENLDPLGLYNDRDKMMLLKDVGLWDVLAGLNLSRFKATGQPIPTSIISYPSSVASSVPTGTPPRSPLLRPGVPSRLASKPPLHGSAPQGSATLTTLSAPEEEDDRLLDLAGTSLPSTAHTHQEAASLPGHGHTRVLHVAPVSSDFGPPSFPASSATLERPDPHLPSITEQPLLPHPTPLANPRGMGGLSRSLSATAARNLLPNGHGLTNTGSASEAGSAPTTLVTSASLPPLAPPMANTVPVQQLTRHVDTDRQVEEANSRQPQEPVGSAERPQEQSSQADGPTVNSANQVSVRGTSEMSDKRHGSEATLQRPASPSQPVPRRGLLNDSRHQGSPSGQGSFRQAPLGSSPQGSSPGQGISRQGSSGQPVRRQADRRLVSERGSLEVPSHYQWPNLGGQLLSMQLGEGGVGLSQGQQQILCLARVLLEQPKVVCLDEATANVDPETARLMQHVLATHLPHSTIMQIAHRLDTIVDCDWAVVMDQGRIVEQGQPQQLLACNGSHFAAMYQAAGK